MNNMRVPFITIFSGDKEVGLTNIVKMRISNFTAEAGALEHFKGAFGGIDWSLFIDNDLEVNTDGDCFVITGIFK